MLLNAVVSVVLGPRTDMPVAFDQNHILRVGSTATGPVSELILLCLWTPSSGAYVAAMASASCVPDFVSSGVPTATCVRLAEGQVQTL